MPAQVTSEPQAKMSMAGDGGPPVTCSGAIQPGDPMIVPTTVIEVASVAVATPKSTTTGLVLGQQHVAGLEVPVGDPGPVDRADGLGQGDHQGHAGAHPATARSSVTASSSVGPSTYPMAR